MEQRSGTLFEFLDAFEAVEGKHVIATPSSAAICRIVVLEVDGLRKRRLVSSRARGGRDAED